MPYICILALIIDCYHPTHSFVKEAVFRLRPKILIKTIICLDKMLKNNPQISIFGLDKPKIL